MEFREETFDHFAEEKLREGSVKDHLPEATIEKQIKDLRVDETVYFGTYLLPFKVERIKNNGWPEVLLVNEKTKLILRGNMKVRSTAVLSRIKDKIKKIKESKR